jgi:hypothetical protein
MNKLGKMRLVLLSGVLCLLTNFGYAQQSKAERDLAELRSWVNSKLDKAEAATRDERSQLREQFSRLSADVEKGATTLSEKSKQEYKDLRSRYNQWDARQQELSSLYIDRTELSRWQAELLGPYQKVQAVKAPQMRDAYQTFIQNVREKRRAWEPEDWVYAEEVLGRLNDRRDKVDASLSTRDQIKIQTVKTEFGTLKAGRNAKEIIKK